VSPQEKQVLVALVGQEGEGKQDDEIEIPPKRQLQLLLWQFQLPDPYV
jgi:hypothetical protein